MRDILTVQGLSVSHGSDIALRDVSLVVQQAEIVGVVGESGSGKSTLLRAVAGLLPPSACMTGTACLEGSELTHVRPKELRSIRGSTVSYLFQNAERSFDPLFTIGSQFDEVMRAHERADRSVDASDPSRSDSMRGARRKVAREQRQARQVEALERMGFSDPDRILGALPSELSGGMAQRVALAFALAGSPRLLLADEPTSALDTAAQGRVLELLREMNEQEGLAILVVSHDIDLVAQFASRIIVMHEGRIVEEGSSSRIMNDPHEPYTRELIAAIPRVLGEIEVERLGACHAPSADGSYMSESMSSPGRSSLGGTHAS